MRRVALLVILGAVVLGVGCSSSARQRGAAAASSSMAASTTVAPTVTTTTTTVESPEAQWRRYIGTEYSGKPSLPADAVYMGGQLLSGDLNGTFYGVDTVGQGPTRLILLFTSGVQQYPGTPHWRVIDVIVQTIDETWYQTNLCDVEGDALISVIAFIVAPTNERRQNATYAWTVNASTGLVEVIDPSRVVCEHSVGD